MSQVQVGEARNSTVAVCVPFHTSVTLALAYFLPMSGELTDSTLAMTINSEFATKSLNGIDATFANNSVAEKSVTKAMNRDGCIVGLDLMASMNKTIRYPSLGVHKYSNTLAGGNGNHSPYGSWRAVSCRSSPE